MLSDEEDEFVAFHMPRKSLSTEFRGKYRIYFRDGTSEDFSAETVTEALSLLDATKKKTVMKIINLETEYRKTLKNNFLLPTEESVPTQIAPDDNAPKNLGFYFFGDLEHEEQVENTEPFEAMSLVDVAFITSGEEIIPASAADTEALAEENPITEKVPAIATEVEEVMAEPVPTLPEQEVAQEVETIEEPAAEPIPAALPKEAARLSTQEVRDLLNDETPD